MCKFGTNRMRNKLNISSSQIFSNAKLEDIMPKSSSRRLRWIYSLLFLDARWKDTCKLKWDTDACWCQHPKCRTAAATPSTSTWSRSNTCMFATHRLMEQGAQHVHHAAVALACSTHSKRMGTHCSSKPSRHLVCAQPRHGGACLCRVEVLFSTKLLRQDSFHLWHPINREKILVQPGYTLPPCGSTWI